MSRAIVAGIWVAFFFNDSVRRRGVNYSQPKPSAAFAFYDYLLTWGESVGETAVFSDVRQRHLLDLSRFPSR